MEVFVVMDVFIGDVVGVYLTESAADKAAVEYYTKYNIDRDDIVIDTWTVGE